MSGAAPGADRIVACLPLYAGYTGHALLEGMIYVAKQANADVINMSIGGLPALNDGNNTRCIVYERLIEQSKVQMFFSIGNSGPGLNTAGDPGVCNKVMGSGAYLTDDTMFADYGVETPYATTSTTSARAVRARTAASSPTRSPLAPLSRPRRCGCRFPASSTSRSFRRATPLPTAPRWRRPRRQASARCS